MYMNCICTCICLHAPFWLQCLGKNPFWALVPESWAWSFGDQNQNKHFSEKGSPGQTTMLTRHTSKFCVNMWFLSAQYRMDVSILAWMSTWFSRWRGRCPSTFGCLAEPHCSAPNAENQYFQCLKTSDHECNVWNLRNMHVHWSQRSHTLRVLSIGWECRRRHHIHGRGLPHFDARYASGPPSGSGRKWKATGLSTACKQSRTVL